MNNRILTIDDLIEYCEKNKLSHFNAKESGTPLVVNTFGKISFSDSQDPSLMKVTLKACHCGINRNNSKISEESMKAAFPTFANKPILAEIITDKDGEKDFGSHAMSFETDEEGNEIIRYIEQPVGIIPETNNIHLEYDKVQDKTYTIVDGYIFNYYGNETSDIIKRKNGTKVSVELEIYDMAWSGKDKVLVINDFSFSGVTLLGEAVGEGMIGSRLDIADFSKKENIDYSEQIIEMQERLKKLESCFNIENLKEGGTVEVDIDKKENFEEVTETEKVTETEETTEEEVTVTENESEETVDETSEVNETVEENMEVDDNTEGFESNEESTESVTENESLNTVKYSFEINGEIKEYAVSLQDKIYAIQDLVNATYAEQDNTYYGVTVYEEYVIMCDWWTGRYYKQSYKDEDGNYSLVGDRVEVYVDFVTEEEQKELESMRSNYSSVVEELNKYKEAEDIADKMSIFDDESYSDYLETDEFKELMSEDTLKKFSKEELQVKADAALGKLVKKNKVFSFSASENKDKKVNKIGINASFEKTDDNEPYGDYFKSLSERY